MTQEEKAKAYDEAIERANELNYVSDKDSLQRKTVEHIFPELQESEDEKIRKEIIDHISNIKSTTISDLREKQFDSWVAWLEKQGEQKPEFCHHEVDLSNCSEEYCKAYYDGWNNCNQQHAQLEAEQKPAWSENGDNHVISITQIIACAIKHNVVSQKTGEMEISWLKSLRPQNTWKPSDEQMENLSRAFNGGTYRASLLMELYQDLKKLKE